MGRVYRNTYKQNNRWMIPTATTPQKKRRIDWLCGLGCVAALYGVAWIVWALTMI